MARTLRVIEDISFSGIGIHSGEPCEVLLRPGDSSGIFFDLPGGFFPVEAADCDGSSRGTRLVFPDGSEILTVEHLLGALAGLEVWSAVISVKGPEIPAMDGSARIFAESIAKAAGPGFEIEPISIIRGIALGDPSRGGFISVIPSDAFEITCAIRYEAKGIGCQVFEGVVTPETFRDDIAPARTFVLASEIEGILKSGLGRGGAFDNVLVVKDDTPPAPGDLRLPDEPVRHKVLDIIGDLATLGAPLRGRVVAYRAGHDLHLELVRRIRRSLVPA
ncbi:MAG: UDP-3-O-acyl-N-acetylglucosamine deacetylase [Thermovirgaceae bacterium]|nr:UDP-3-O-acyl-N-acetylglucosamine deacetylase [Thermovirgaceae bacterium]